MIKDNLKNAEKYYSLSPRIEAALKFLKENDLNSYEKGSYKIDGDNLYMNVEEYQTRISDKIESHKKYIDIQYMLIGEENMGVADISSIKPICEYDNQKDIIFYNGNAGLNLVRENEFIIFYPSDGHLPCQVVDAPKTVKKIIMKIKI